ncbi:GDSL esterase/lipase At1g06990-like [Durio zibethinus]|uniref:GDSL esterase/lipase At1g06990-like n=1 Tax=Durio zibethinus TaxID=66656 RepID=A0A6P5XLF1_DURZI|nr:GDSL esterase/lipase At1g06990-like [Durio zibethinus]
MATSTLFIISLLHTWMNCISTSHIMKPSTLPKFTAIFIFGDSTVDTGNNNYINTYLKGNYPPYGLDFSGHIPTGWFSNGKFVPDYLASSLGIKDTIPPFLNPNLSDNYHRTGVNFASAGSVYDDLTSKLSSSIPLSEQIELFRSYLEKLEVTVGEEKAKTIIGGAVVVNIAGTNDFIFNFYDIPTRRLQFNISEYQTFLQQSLEKIVMELYDLGFRNMVIGGLRPIGCLPFHMIKL